MFRLLAWCRTGSARRSRYRRLELGSIVDVLGGGWYGRAPRSRLHDARRVRLRQTLLRPRLDDWRKQLCSSPQTRSLTIMFGLHVGTVFTRVLVPTFYYDTESNPCAGPGCSLITRASLGRVSESRHGLMRTPAIV